jgi:hypothetical protein
MGVFARLAQTTFLLGQALRLIRFSSAHTIDGRQEEMAQLRRTLLALVHATDVEANVRILEFCAQSGLSFRSVACRPTSPETYSGEAQNTKQYCSAILLLQEHQVSVGASLGYNEVHFHELWQESQNALQRLSDAAKFRYESDPGSMKSADRVPVFMVHAMYQAASAFLMLAPDEMIPIVEEQVVVFKNVLQMLDTRWQLAGQSSVSLEAPDPDLFVIHRSVFDGPGEPRDRYIDLFLGDRLGVRSST